MSHHFTITWRHHMNVLDEFQDFLSAEEMIDVTLACDGGKLKAHKIVLSACSPYFKSLFLENPCKHPIVILKDVKYIELKAIIQFMYHGQMKITEDMILSVLKTAQTLKVKGLEELTFENQSDDDFENLFDNEFEESAANEFEFDNKAPQYNSALNLLDKPVSYKRENEIYESEIQQNILFDDNDYKATDSSTSQFQITNSIHNSPQIHPVEQNFDKIIQLEKNFKDLQSNILTTNDLSSEPSESCFPSTIEQAQSSKNSSSNLVLNKASTAISSDNNHQATLETQSTLSGGLRSKMKSKEISEKSKLNNSQTCKLKNEGNPNSQRNVKSFKNIKSLMLKNNSCSDLPLQITSSKNLETHTTIKNLGRHRKFHCDQCSFKAFTKYELEKHIVKVHKGKKPFECMVCNFFTIEVDVIKRHITEVHGKTSPRSLKNHTNNKKFKKAQEITL